jgi:Tfp pilus assembly PilM family ATPase
MGNPSVGLVFRPDAIEAVVLTKAFRGLMLERCARINIVTEAQEQTGFQDQEMAQALQEALSACQASTRQAAVTVPAKDVLLRCFKLPMLPKAEWEQAVQFEVRKYIPFKVEELTWTYSIVEHRAEKRLTVVFIGIRTDALVKIQRYLATAGIDATGIEALSVSLARAASRGGRKPSKDGFVGVVDLEQDVAHIILMKNSLPYLSRDVSLEVEGRSELLGAQEPKAQIDRRAELLLSELRLSLEYFTHEHASATIERILLFGEEDAVAPWCPWLSEQLHCPVELGSLAIQVPPGSPAAPLPFASAVGLAMRAHCPTDLKLDFLLHGKSTLQRQTFDMPMKTLAEFLRRMVKPAAIQAGLAAVLLAVTAWVHHREVAVVQTQLDQVILAHQQLGHGLEQKTLEDLQKLPKRVNARMAFLRRGILERVSLAQKLDVLAKTMPDGMWLDSISYTNRLANLESWQPSLILRGACLLPDVEQELEVISDFAQQIKQDPTFFHGFADAKLEEILANEDVNRRYSYRTFRLSCQTQNKMF